ncbi:MAG: hypothetical protein JWN17_1709 [Frankiales bacterium]|nr:hypothetical protein [Frankiales bacterium]
MAVGALVDTAATQLLAGLEAVRTVPAPLGQHAARLSVLAHAAAELQGVYLRELAATSPEEAGCRNVADVLVDHAGLPVWQARSDAALAAKLAKVPGALDALAEGGVELAAARLLAKAFAALPPRLRDRPTADALISLAGLVDLATLRAKVDELVAALAPDVTDSDIADAREQAELVLVDVGARTRMDAELDVVQGEWLREVLLAKAEADRGSDDPRSSGARLLDALLDCVRTAVDAGAVPQSDGAPPTLVVVTSVQDLATVEDAAAAVRPEDALVDLFEGTDLGSPTTPSGAPRWSTCTRGRTPLGPRTLGALCCTAKLTRLLLSPAGSPLDSSPEARQISRRERRALEHRAGYRCEREGCGRPAAVCVPHHVVPFALGGSSTQANTVLLCRSCHHLLHDRGRDLGLTGDRRIGPRGWVRGRPPP